MMASRKHTPDPQQFLDAERCLDRNFQFLSDHKLQKVRQT